MKWAEQMGQALGILEEAYSRTESVLSPNHRIDTVLVAEVSQQMYGGILGVYH